MRPSVSEYEVEPTPGLPEVLPAGETVLWRGAPTWWGIATNVFHIRVLAIYFAALIVWSIVAGVQDGRGLLASIGGALRILPIVAVIALGLVALLAVVVERTTLYTVTSKRVVIRFGMAMPLAVNLPFAKIESAALKLRPDGTGDIVLATVKGESASALFLWPHTRPMHFWRAQPMLRCIPDAAKVADILARTLATTAPGVVTEVRQPATRATELRGTKQRANEGAVAAFGA